MAMGEKELKNVPVFSGGLHNVAQIKIWQEILKNETEMARQWDDKWGFFRAPERKPRSEMRRSAGQSHSSSLARSVSTPALATAAREVVQPMRSGEAEGPAGMSFIDDRHRVLDRRHRLVPRERYTKPATTAQQVGWNRSLELFGVAQHGVRRDQGIQPSY
mmetsp:Transcript_90456/g.269943  ORF Transcript_90456/g.269943 Transcript_90456/m.269943 type:complete len:161 (+) Transcript_90456:48-530(+)